METNKHLEILQQNIGKAFTNSPSPFTHWLNPIIITAEYGKLTFQYQVRKEMTNPIGTLHGGVTAAIIDDVLGATMFTLGEPYFYTTINNVIDYLSAARENDIIIAKTSITKKGKQFINAQCEIWNGDESKLIAKGYSNLFKTEFKR